MKVKMFMNSQPSFLCDNINKFIKNKDVIDVKYTAQFLNEESIFTTMILYNEEELNEEQ